MNRQKGKRIVAAAILAIFAVGVSTISLGQNPLESGEESEEAHATDDPFKIAKLVVTGTRIRGKAGEPIAPVEVYTGEELVRRGYTTLADFSRDLTINSGLTEFTSFDGSASFNLRGLGTDATLTILNGRRLATREVGSRIDINAFPVSVIDRIEILKDGASAIYGPDAVGGVVNIILKKDYLGTEFMLQHRNTTESDTSEYQVTASFGRFIGDGSIWGFVSHQEINALEGRDRGVTRDGSDLVRGQGDSMPDSAFQGDFRSGSSFPGNYIILNEDGTTAFSSDPNCQNASNPFGVSALGELTGVLGFDEYLSDDICRYDVPQDQRIMLEASRSTGYAGFDFPVGDQAIFGEVYYNERESLNAFFRAFPDPLPFVAADHPHNPFDRNVVLLYVIGDAGRQRTDNDWQLLQGTLGSRGRIGRWDYEVALFGGKNNQERTFQNRIRVIPFLDALAGRGGSGGDSYYNPFGGVANDPDILNQMTIDVTSKFDSSSFAIEAFASRSLFEWKHGVSDLALGAEYRDLDNDIRTNKPNEPIYGLSDFENSSFGREVTSVFAELTLPIYQDFDLQLAARFEDFSDFGSKLSPKVALRWQANKSLILRGSYSQAYKPPNLLELFGVPVTDRGQYIDPLRCDDNPEPDIGAECAGDNSVRRVFEANEDLDPESGESIVLGFVFSPPNLADFAINLDYWQFNYDERIQSLSQNSVALFFPDDPRFVVRAEPTEADIAAARPGRVVELRLPFINFERLETEGVDAAVTWGTQFRKLGQLDLDFRATYLSQYEFTDSQSANPGNRAGRTNPFPLPKWRSNLAATWTNNNNVLTVFVDRIHSLLHEPDLFPAAKTGAHYTVDIQYQRTVPRWNQAQFQIGCIDCFDEQAAKGADSRNQLFLSGLYDPRGRQLTASVTVPF